MGIFIFCFLASCGLAAGQGSEVTVRGQRRDAGGSRGIHRGVFVRHLSLPFSSLCVGGGGQS